MGASCRAWRAPMARPAGGTFRWNQWLGIAWGLPQGLSVGSSDAGPYPAGNLRLSCGHEDHLWGFLDLARGTSSTQSLVLHRATGPLESSWEGRWRTQGLGGRASDSGASEYRLRNVGQLRIEALWLDVHIGLGGVTSWDVYLSWSQVHLPLKRGSYTVNSRLIGNSTVIGGRVWHTSRPGVVRNSTCSSVFVSFAPGAGNKTVTGHAGKDTQKGLLEGYGPEPGCFFPTTQFNPKGFQGVSGKVLSVGDVPYFNKSVGH